LSNQLENFILATASTTRVKLLNNAGLVFDVIPANIDEEKIKDDYRGETADFVAQKLSDKKAEAISEKHPDKLVIAADQVLVCDGQLFSKPCSLDEVKTQLFKLQGRPHELISAVSAAKLGKSFWRHSDAARLVMRLMSDKFIDNYIKQEGQDLLSSVGGYKIEGSGVLLFDEVEGSFFTILGVPLLQLLAFFREQKILLQ